MGLPWIESHVTLEDHPKLALLCSKTGWSVPEAIGQLHRLWWWALKYAEDGDLSKYEPTQFLGRLDDKIAPEKLLETLKECRFISVNNVLHNWLDFTGKYLNGKYRSSNPKKLKEIYKKNKSDFRRTKVGLKSDSSPTTLPYLTLPYLTLPNHTVPDLKTRTSSFEEVMKNEDFKAKLIKAYPSVKIDREFEKIAAWVSSNPERAKKNWKRFVNSWLARAENEKEEKSGTVDQGNSQYENIGRKV